MTQRKISGLVAALAAVSALLAPTAGAVEPGSQLIGCEQADTRLTITASTHLDPSCTWTRGADIVASGVVFDCQGAHIVTTDRRHGILVTAPADVALSDVVVRNCHIEGFLNNIHIEREGFRDLAEGAEYDHAFSNIVIEDSTLRDSRGVGLFVDGYVTGVTLRNLHVEGAGSTGIYLEAGSKDNVVERCTIVNNGYSENGPGGQFVEFAGLTFWFWGTGREGLAIDGSRDNRVVDNHFSGNSAGGIFLYKNCGEFVNERPARWWHRRYGADGNLIEGNTFSGEDIGVWIGSRMGENTLPMDCSDPAYVSSPLQRVVLDRAGDTVVRANLFARVRFGVRVEDDGAVIAENVFAGDSAEQAILIGTPHRTQVLGLPVRGTAVTGNQAAIPGNQNPYRWIHGHAETTFTGNTSRGRVVGLCEGEPPLRSPFIFVVGLVAAEPGNPPAVDPPVIPPPAPLPPCPLACASPVAVTKPTIAIRGLDTPAGDDRLAFRGRLMLGEPLDPPLDPVAAGAGVLITDSAGGSLLDVAIPGGAFDRATGRGWRAVPARGRWSWVDRSPVPPGGVTALAIRYRPERTPGLVQFSLRARRGANAVDPARLPLAGLLVLDPPTAETGQCGRATFPGPAPACAAGPTAVRCR